MIRTRKIAQVDLVHSCSPEHLHGYYSRQLSIADPERAAVLRPPYEGQGLFREVPSKDCFVDEAGALGANGGPPLLSDQPVLVRSGSLKDVASLANLPVEFLEMRHRFFRGLLYRSAKPPD